MEVLFLLALCLPGAAKGIPPPQTPGCLEPVKDFNSLQSMARRELRDARNLMGVGFPEGLSLLKASPRQLLEARTVL